MSTETNESTVTVRSSRDGKLYYVEGYEYHRPTAWLAKEPGQDGKFVAYPFAFYEINSGDEESLPVSHELVVRYAASEGWPERGSPAWFEEARRVRNNMGKSLADAEGSVAFYRSKVDELDKMIRSAATAL